MALGSDGPQTVTSGGASRRFGGRLIEGPHHNGRPVVEHLKIERIIEARVKNGVGSEGFGSAQESKICFTLRDALVGRYIIAFEVGLCRRSDHAASF